MRKILISALMAITTVVSAQTADFFKPYTATDLRLTLETNVPLPFTP